MSNLRIEEIKPVYSKMKLLAKQAFELEQYEIAIKHIEIAAEIAYMFNWIYSDEELEILLQEISQRIIQEKRTFEPVKGKMVFYDAFAFDNKGLTQQYLRALMSWGVEILFIFEGNNFTHSENIIKELKAYPKSELLIVDKALTAAEKSNLIHNKIIDFKPEKAFLHLHPSSAVAVVVFNSLPELTRYQINLTDHAFWLGTKCIDYCIEFRNYGCTVSAEKRDLKVSQLLKQPYYPILECQPFKGLPPTIAPDSIKIFTGGQYYKMYGRDDLFFTLLKTLIDLNSKVIILLAGGGEISPLENFIRLNHYENRIFLLGSRSDITHVFENCDIYLSTYPITGGLMGQYAAAKEKPILSFTTDDILCNFSEGFLNWKSNSDFKITHTSLSSFKSEALKLIENSQYREEKGKENKRHLITENEFSENLKELVSINSMATTFLKEEINYDVFYEMYIERENKYLKQFYSMIFYRFKIKSVLLFPKQTFLFFCSFSNVKLIFKKSFRKIFFKLKLWID